MFGRDIEDSRSILVLSDPMVSLVSKIIELNVSQYKSFSIEKLNSHEDSRAENYIQSLLKYYT